MSKGTMISLFDRSGVMARPWAEAGYDCHILDIEHPGERLFEFAKNITAHPVDLVEYDGIWWVTEHFNWGDVAFVSMFPPCTHASLMGACHWKKKGPQMLIDLGRVWRAVGRYFDFFIDKAPVIIENPKVGNHLTIVIGKPQHHFDPWWYGDDYTKRTNLWTRLSFIDRPYENTFIMPPREYRDGRIKNVNMFETNLPVIYPREDYIVNMPGNKDRGYKRSITPAGFARAVFEANKRKESEQ